MEIELTPCPFCGRQKVFIGVHDDEGNYHGPLGCKYESDPWSGLSYALHHQGWGECILCSDGANEVMGGVLFDTVEEAAEALESLGRRKGGHMKPIYEPNCSARMNKAASPHPAPLSLDQVRERQCESHLFVLDKTEGRVFEGMSGTITTRDFRLVTALTERFYNYDHYGETWVAYDYRPGEGTGS